MKSLSQRITSTITRITPDFKRHPDGGYFVFANRPQRFEVTWDEGYYTGPTKADIVRRVLSDIGGGLK